ncbi:MULTISPECIES: sporulation initiation factor Spo0A C-terminal domain-containing protein [Claveliimonas]|nr:sporulation initiation factor Spo0A C-terminal domain-containing protein [Claveliimonas bilis]MCQ5202767.1 sporulation initiation factor Spo0A C-terminal domain-containing protein [Mordavella massiliensis]
MEAIQYLVRSLGIGATYRGYRYLVIAIDLCLRDEDYLLGISKVLYPKIAEICHTSVGSVERDLRTVINVCWERGNRSLLTTISPCPLLSKPTTGEFVDILTGHLRGTLVS